MLPPAESVQKRSELKMSAFEGAASSPLEDYRHHFSREGQFVLDPRNHFLELKRHL